MTKNYPFTNKLNSRLNALEDFLFIITGEIQHLAIEPASKQEFQQIKSEKLLLYLEDKLNIFCLLLNINFFYY